MPRRIHLKCMQNVCVRVEVKLNTKEYIYPYSYRRSYRTTLTHTHDPAMLWHFHISSRIIRNTELIV